MSTWVLEACIAVVLALVSASGIWLWFALREPAAPRRIARRAVQDLPPPVPPPTMDLVSAQEAWRREQETRSPVPAALLHNEPPRAAATGPRPANAACQPRMERVPPQPIDASPNSAAAPPREPVP